MSGFNSSFFPGVDPTTLTQPISGGASDAALGSIFGTVGSFLNPVAGFASLLGPALGGAPSSAASQADSGAPVNFAPVQIGTGNAANPAVSNTDTQTTTQVPVQPTVGVNPGYAVPPSYGVAEGSSRPSSSISPLVLGGAGLAGLAALLFLR